VSEAFAFGVPVILSGLTAEAFGLTKQDKIGCIGTTVDSFKDCILRLYHNETDWKESRENAMEFIRSTHSRDSVVEKWSTVINKALATGRQRHSMFQSAERKDEVLKHKFLKTKVPDFQLRSS
jgi:Glycosyltransferase